MLITKSQAQEILGGSERKIERLVKSGKLPVAHYEKGARKPTPFFRQSDVEALRDDATERQSDAPGQSDAEERESDAPSTKGSATERQSVAQSVSPTTRQSNGVGERALVRAPLPQQGEGSLDAGQLSARLVEVLETLAAQNDTRLNRQSGKATALADLSVKLLLTVPECSALTGLSRATINDAITNEQLAAKQIGRARRVKRVDLEAWVKGL